ncbi:MAG TPA: glycosyltransferase family 1 protein [Rhodobacterales bacterium]|nr:glycosyltransferase family 1 protein [Rhodobacterales bacterium]
MPTPQIASSLPPARLLDLTRLVSRVGRGPWTGIDRVEAAWLDRLLDEPTPLFALVRTNLGFALLDRTGMHAMAERLHGRTPWGPSKGLAQLSFRASPARRQAMSDLRHLALVRCTQRGLARMLRRQLPDGTIWLALSHTNLSRPVFEAVKALPGAKAHVLLHDVIPLKFPKWQDPRVLTTFTHSLHNISALADLVICNSQTTRMDASVAMKATGRVPPMIVAPLGIDPAAPDFSALPEGALPDRPFFIALGTQQPHKNLGFLLDIWEKFAKERPKADIPALLFVGARSPTNPGFAKRLETSPLLGHHVFELTGLSDGAVSALVARARALLMPSLYEGFGLPPGEALALGTPVIANDLPVYREAFGNNLVYADCADMYSWAERILDLARAEQKPSMAADGEALGLPTWQAHFNLVLKVT